MSEYTESVELSNLANEAHTIGASKLSKGQQDFTVVVFPPRSDPRTELRRGHTTEDGLCAVHYEEPASRWSVTLLRSGLEIAQCKTHQAAVTLVGLVYIDSFLFEAAQADDYVTVQRLPKVFLDDKDDKAKRKIVQTAYTRVKCCADNRLDELT